MRPFPADAGAGMSQAKGAGQKGWWMACFAGTRTRKPESGIAKCLLKARDMGGNYRLNAGIDKETPLWKLKHPAKSDTDLTGCVPPKGGYSHETVPPGRLGHDCGWTSCGLAGSLVEPLTSCAR